MNLNPMQAAALEAIRYSTECEKESDRLRGLGVQPVHQQVRANLQLPPHLRLPRSNSDFDVPASPGTDAAAGPQMALPQPEVRMASDAYQALTTPEAQRLMYEAAMQLSPLREGIGGPDVTPEALERAVRRLLMPEAFDRIAFVWRIGEKMADAVDSASRKLLRENTIGDIAEHPLTKAVITTLAQRLRPEVGQMLLDQYRTAMDRWHAGQVGVPEELSAAILQAALQAIRAQYEDASGAAGGTHTSETGTRPGDAGPQAVGQERSSTSSQLPGKPVVDLLLRLCREGETPDVMRQLHRSSELRDLLLHEYLNGAPGHTCKAIGDLSRDMLGAGVPEERIEFIESILDKVQSKFIDSITTIESTAPLGSLANYVGLQPPSLKELQARDVELQKNFDASGVAPDARQGGFPLFERYVRSLVLDDGTLPQLDALLKALETTFAQHDLPWGHGSPRCSAIQWLCKTLARDHVAEERIDRFVIEVAALIDHRQRVGKLSKNSRRDLTELLDSVSPNPSEPNPGVSSLKRIQEAEDARAQRESELQQVLLESRVSGVIEKGGFPSFVAHIRWLVLRDGTAGPPQLERLLSELEAKCVDSEHTPVVNARRSAYQWLGHALVARFLPPDKAPAFNSTLADLMTYRDICREPSEKLHKDLADLLHSVR